MTHSDLRQKYKDILSAIDSANHIMMVMHQKPDGDTSGACLALAHYMDTLEKNYTCFCIDELSPTLRFMPGSHKITTEEHHWHPKKATFDLLIVLDSGDLRYAGVADYVDQLTHDFTIINIDHHATNTAYGDHNLVITTASSTCEIVHNILDSTNALNKNIATCLMTGLVTDTGCFTNLATSASAIETGARLLKKGVSMNHITKHTMDNRKYAALKLWGRALERLQKTPYGIVATVITQQDLEECGSGKEAVEGVANFLNSLDEEVEAPAILVLSEREKGLIKGSFRTTHPLIDVSKFATILGGGGHKKAAGFTVPGKIILEGNRWSVQPLHQNN